MAAIFKTALLTNLFFITLQIYHGNILILLMEWKINIALSCSKNSILRLKCARIRLALMRSPRHHSRNVKLLRREEERGGWRGKGRGWEKEEDRRGGREGKGGEGKGREGREGSLRLNRATSCLTPARSCNKSMQ